MESETVVEDEEIYPLEEGIGSSTHRRVAQLIEYVLEEGKALDAVPRMFHAGRFKLLSTENAEDPVFLHCGRSGLFVVESEPAPIE